jgi:hypothetical protein
MPDQSQVPAADIIHRLIPGESAATFQLLLKNALVSAGWTATELRCWQGMSMRGAAAEGNTVTIDGLVYTFKAAINNANPREILLDNSGDLSGNLINLMHAVNDDGINKGTAYSNATTAHPTCGDAVVENGRFLVWYKTPGMVGERKTWGTSLYVWGASGSNSGFGGAGWRLVSAPTEDGYTVAVEITRFDPTNDGDVQWLVGDPTKARTGNRSSNWASGWGTQDNSVGSLCLPMAGGRVYRTIAHRHAVWLAPPGNCSGRAQATAGTLAVPARMKPKKLVYAAGGGGDPVTCTVYQHGLGGAGGTSVYLYGVTGFPIDGPWSVVVIDEDTFQLMSSTLVPAGYYNGDDGSAVCAATAIAQVARLFYGIRSGNHGNGYGPRYSLDSAWGSITDCVNSHFISDQSQSGLRCKVELNPNSGLRWVGNKYWLTPAPLIWSRDPAAGPTLTMGWMYGAALISATLPLDSDGVDVNGQKWIVWGPQVAQGWSLILAIPPGFN